MAVIDALAWAQTLRGAGVEDKQAGAPPAFAGRLAVGDTLAAKADL